MIRAIIFDLDGVLVDADEWHFDALNMALKDHDLPEISWQEHLSIYKGLPTKQKLALYAERHDVAPVPRTVEYGKRFWTDQFIQWKCKPDPEKVDMVQRLAERYPVVVASNAIRSSVDAMLEGAGLEVLFSLSNQDVEKPKPDPEVYVKAFEMLGHRPEDCLIVEDSAVGRAAATASGAHLCAVSGPEDVNYYRVTAAIRKANQVNVVIPAAGQGKRFAEAGYLYPKPLIDVDGEPMLRRVLDNVAPLGTPIVIGQKDHIARYSMQGNFPDASFVQVEGLTEGAACTVLTAHRYIDNQYELVLANSDQLVEPFPLGFLEWMRARDADGGILTFRANDPKWSFVHADQSGRVSRVAEKEVISDLATVGVYYFRTGSDFVWAAREMIRKDIRTNGEFYVAPVYNELIAVGKRIYSYEIDAGAMIGLGTPEDLATAVAA